MAFLIFLYLRASMSSAFLYLFKRTAFSSLSSSSESSWSSISYSSWIASLFTISFNSILSSASSSSNYYLSLFFFFLFLFFSGKSSPFKINFDFTFIYYLKRLLSLETDISIVHLNVRLRQIHVTVMRNSHNWNIGF